MQQLRAELALQLLHRRRHARLGHAQALGRPRVAGQLGHPDEDLHGFELIHDDRPSRSDLYCSDYMNTTLNIQPGLSTIMTINKLHSDLNPLQGAPS